MRGVAIDPATLQRLLAYYAEGASDREVSDRFGVSTNSVCDLTTKAGIRRARRVSAR